MRLSSMMKVQNVGERVVVDKIRKMRRMRNKLYRAFQAIARSSSYKMGSQYRVLIEA